eukprot:11100016-Alexandrium_andersonii.AAC.1
MGSGAVGTGFSLNLQGRLNFLTEAAKPMVSALASHLRGWSQAQETAPARRAELAAAGTGAGSGLDRGHA